MAERRRGRPTAVGDALHSYLRKSGLGERVAQAQVIPDWPRLVGPQIAAVTAPESVSPDGTLFATCPRLAQAVRDARPAERREEPHDRPWGER